MSDNLRDRWKAVSNSDSQQYKEDALFSAWDNQKKARLEEKKNHEKLQQLREQDRELKKQQLKSGSVSFFHWLKKLLKSIFEWINFGFREIVDLLRKNKTSRVVTILLLVVFSGIIMFGFTRNNSSNQATLGESEDFIDKELPRESASFDLLFPAGTTDSDFEIVRLAGPSGNEQAYTFVDVHETSGATLKITQQKVSEDMNVEEAAKNLQATDKIQIDETVIYHGYNDDAKVQSIVYKKDETLVLIASSRKLSDDQWVAYILSLN